MIEAEWQVTVSRARELSEATLNERVDDEWSFVETLRHLVLATDCWLRRMVKGIDRPYHPWGLAGSWLSDPGAWGLEAGANPSLDEVLDVRRTRMDEVEHTIAALTPEELERVCVPPDAPGHPDREHTRPGMPPRDSQRGVGAPPLRGARSRGARKATNAAGVRRACRYVALLPEDAQQPAISGTRNRQRPCQPALTPGPYDPGYEGERRDWPVRPCSISCGRVDFCLQDCD